LKSLKDGWWLQGAVGQLAPQVGGAGDGGWLKGCWRMAVVVGLWVGEGGLYIFQMVRQMGSGKNQENKPL